MPQNASVKESFRIVYRQEDGKNYLSFQPIEIDNPNYPSKEIEVTEEQWNGLKYHFATAINAKAKITKLIYII